MNSEKNLEIKVLEAINHILIDNDNLSSNLHSILLERFGVNGVDLRDLYFLTEISKNLLKSSKSQIKQDLFVLNELAFKKDGYFIEFGATNGIDMSNSYLLEKDYGWKGILAEPATFWHEELYKNRKCSIEKKCVWSESGLQLEFNQVNNAETLSTINLFSNNDSHNQTRLSGQKYTVETISLNDLLVSHNAPLEIDYLSIDTEGSEFEILNNFNFDKYNIKIITCEHNFTPLREKIFELLSRNGYLRKYETLSQFDDWYVRL